MDEKKGLQLPELATTLCDPPSVGATDLVLEIDELWSFVRSKKCQVWIWIVLCRTTRQVVAYAVGDRSAKTCWLLWRRIPRAYRAGRCYTDFYSTYTTVIPVEQHVAVGKETGETAHVERWNNTLRQRVGRFVRKTLSFSKAFEMHEIALQLFLHAYNREVAITRV
jgi:insertion element IS1 protein InsB